MVALLAVALPVLLSLAGCSGQAGSDGQQSGADVVGSLGRVPIPTASQGPPAPVPASVGHPQLLAMGAPIDLTLPGGVRAVVTTLGPSVELPAGGVKPNVVVPGVIELTATSSAGTVRLAAADLASRDQRGSDVALTPVGPAEVSASPGHPATLRVRGTFAQGGAQVNWRQSGHVIAIWDFTIEAD